MTPETVAKVNDLRLRCQQAKALRKEGKNLEADALEPSLDELRAGLIALRTDREQATSTRAAKKADSAAKAIPLDLNDLFASAQEKSS